MVCLLQQNVKKIKQNKKIFRDAFLCTSNFNSLSLVVKANLKQKAKIDMTGKMSKQMKTLLAQLCPRTPRMSKIQFILQLLLIGLMILFHNHCLEKNSNFQPK